MNRVLTSSARTGTGRDDWCTPSSILERVRQHGPISLDPCSGAGSVVEARVAFTKRQNGLVQDWAARVSDHDLAMAADSLKVLTARAGVHLIGYRDLRTLQRK